MKTRILAVLTAASIITTAFAGEPTQTMSGKETMGFAPSYGTGWYGALQVGSNVYQDFGDSNTENFFGLQITEDLDGDVGIFAGLKLGYVFGTGFVRPAIELDAYYNGFDSEYSLEFKSSFFGTDRFSASEFVHTGAGLVNFLLKFDFGRFQPYIGAGAGAQYTDLDESFTFAWQLIGGADYYFTEKVSAFLEYKFLNYEDVNYVLDGDALRQHLVGAGIRFHF